jgi:tetratricopeptide (TPR) repeat protein
MAAAAPIAHGMTESLVEIGNIYFAHGYPAKAAEFYEKGLAAFPRKGVGDRVFRQRYAQVMNNKAVAYLAMGDVDRAEATYRESLAAYPDQPDIRKAATRENLERVAKYLTPATN